MKNKEYYDSLDKRSKEYKTWKANYENAPSGLGDVIEKITEKTGIKKVVEHVFGDDCGCKERKEKLNNIRFKPVRCFDEQQFNDWTNFRNRQNKNTITHDQQLFVIKMMEHIFARTSKACTSCGGQIRKFVKQIDNFYETYL